MKITDEMVERAAQALWTQARPISYPYERLIEPTQADLRAYARAALEAAVEDG